MSGDPAGRCPRGMICAMSLATRCTSAGRRFGRAGPAEGVRGWVRAAAARGLRRARGPVDLGREAPADRPSAGRSEDGGRAPARPKPPPPHESAGARGPRRTSRGVAQGPPRARARDDAEDRRPRPGRLASRPVEAVGSASVVAPTARARPAGRAASAPGRQRRPRRIGPSSRRRPARAPLVASPEPTRRRNLAPARRSAPDFVRRAPTAECSPHWHGTDAARCGFAPCALAAVTAGRAGPAPLSARAGRRLAPPCVRDRRLVVLRRRLDRCSAACRKFTGRSNRGVQALCAQRLRRIGQPCCKDGPTARSGLAGDEDVA